MPTLSVKGLDFLFILAFLLGLYAVHRLLAVREHGEVREKVVRQALFAEMGNMVRQVSTAAGVRQLIVFPSFLMRGARERGEANAKAEE